MIDFSHPEILDCVKRALDEDIGSGDVTSQACIPAERRAGRLIFNSFPTGLEVCPAIVHGGPYPATMDEKFTSVGSAAILRFARPVCYQNFPEALLPAELQNANVRGIIRNIDGRLTRDPL